MSTAPRTAPTQDGQVVLSFIDAARRRAFARLLLHGALLAALVNEAARWLAVGAVLWAGWEIPVVDVGPLFLAALVPFAWRRMSRAASAALADAALGFRDRLLSFLDFRRRTDLPAAVRAAQAAEVAIALAGSRPSAAIPIRARAYAGPLLLLASLAYPLLFVEAPDTSTVRVVQRIAPGGRVIRTGPGAQFVKVPPAKQPPPGTKPGAPPPAGKPEDPQKPPEKPGTAKGPAPAADAGGETTRTPPPPSRRPPGERTDEQRAQIASQRVGAELSKVVDPVYNPNPRDRSAGRDTPAGSVAFHLVPKASKRGDAAADVSVEQVTPDRVVVDFDALPERYRPLVKAYFLLLSQRKD